ncbi:hypothetical protein [Streptomyces sp. NPDC004230]
MATTRHTCGGPKYGRLAAGCPRCDELLGGAKPIRSSVREDDQPKTTPHTHQVVFGRRVAGCPRCTELDAGAKPVRQNRRPERQQTGGYPTNREIADHFAPGSPHARGACGPVCTFGDW